MSERERIGEMLSRGLDADLDRAEMRELYRLAGRDPLVPQEMGDLAQLEDELAAINELTAAATPALDLADTVRASIAETHVEPKTSWLGQVWAWIISPKGFSVQPLSFVTGVAIAVLGLGTVTPVLTKSISEQVSYEPPRLSLIDMQFDDAKPRVDWTYQFIVPPGEDARLLIDHGGKRAVKFQFEADEPVDLALVHHAPGNRRDTVQGFTVHGIGYASLQNPKPGDTVTVRNGGSVPVLIYAFSPRSGNSSVSQGQSF
ncbi:MAG: hypothetical protein HOH04_05900 [Rhodospirillaceae bacterium]|nr:hypothetical protein [Rhodospirillaceae bacterium]